MKLEPLKEKKIYFKNINFNLDFPETLYTKSQIKSVVEWLKEQLKKELKTSHDTLKSYELLNKAFEDVMEK